MESKAMEAWARHAPLWNSDRIAEETRRWLAGDGKGLLQLKASQIHSLRDAAIQARTNAELKEAIGKLGGEAAKHGKSPWKGKGDDLRGKLWTAVEAAVRAAQSEQNDENAAFGALRKLAGEEAQAGIVEERDLRMRKQFLLFVVERHQAKKWMKWKEVKA